MKTARVRHIKLENKRKERSEEPDRVDAVGNLNLRLPDYLHDHVGDIAKREGIAVNQLILLAVAEQVSALDAETYLLVRAERADARAFKEVFDSVPDTLPEERNAIPEDLQKHFSK